MTSVSISQLKVNPARVIAAAGDYPVEIKNRSNTEAYLVGRELFERLERYMEDFLDRRAVEDTDFSKGKDLREVMKSLGI